VTQPRVLLVEDDPLVRRFVQMALDPLGVSLVQCATLAEAKQALTTEVAPLVLTDLTLPDGSGLDLLGWMQASLSLQGAACRTVVFSGGIDPATQRRLESLNVWRVLHKPASVGALMACVSETLASPSGEEPAALAVAPLVSADPVAEFFGGNRALYEAYRQACLARFPQDVIEGDLAVAAQDAQALRRVAHNLKSVLTMLGEAQAAQCARSNEEWAAAGDLEPMQLGWQQLRQHVLLLVSIQGKN
jgi:DNA-binding NtrC family response regulator